MNELLTSALWAGAGAGAALAISAIIVLIRRRALHRRNARRDRIVTSVQEKWTDVDSILASYRAERISTEEFRNSLLEKIETVNRTYKPGVHVLDIFFVKYTEKLIEEYSRIAESGVIETVQRETVSMMFPPLAAAARKRGAIVPPKEEAQVLKAGTEHGEPVPETASRLSDDAVISAVAESSKEEKDLPLETFLAMDTGSGVIGETARATAVPEGRQDEQKVPVPPEEKAPGVGDGLKEGAAIDPGLTEETMTSATVAQFSLADKVSKLPPAPAEEPYAVKQEEKDEETMAEAAVSFPVRIPAAPLSKPPAARASLSSRMPAPEKQEEKIPQPATMYDIEAETIIADRNDLLGVSKRAEQTAPGDKSQIGITGDDVSDMLDQFFAGKQ
ncbi:MAG: hypothetical protein JXA71_20570 [Chitinispirillaceae bacterium]|nr:hypothetical protein [Chitinispirillaceae bacterium]